MEDNFIFLEKNKILGTIISSKIYSWYDGPLLLKAFDEYGNYYFCYSLGYDEENDSENWLLVKTTEQSMIELEKNKISITDFVMDNYLSKEKVYLVKFYDNNEIVELLSEETFNFKMPEKDIFLFP